MMVCVQPSKGILISALALALAGVQGAAMDARAAPKESLVLAMALEPPFLDPTAGASSSIREIVNVNLFEGLVRIAENGETRPALARSWTVSSDGKTYAFELAGNVRFHDGSPFDCASVKFSFERAVAPGSTNSTKKIFEPIESIECPDPLRAVIALKGPRADFLFGLGWGDAVIVSPRSAASNKTNPVGTGPFKFKAWVKGDKVELVRNSDYWGQKAKLSSVAFRFIADPTAAAAAMSAGDVDAYPLFPAAEALPQFQKNPRFSVVIGYTQGKVILALNNARKPFDDVRMRRALAFAIDRAALRDATFGNYGILIGAHYTPSDPGFIDLANAYPFDPAMARSLLAEAGVKPGHAMTILLPPPVYARRGGEVVAAFLSQVGIEARLEPIEFAQWLDRVYRRADYDATMIAHTEARDIDIYARENYYFNYKSPEFRKVFQEFAEATSQPRIDELAQAMQRRLSDDQPNVFLYLLPKIGVWNSKLKGMWANLPLPTNDLTQVYWAE